MRNLLILFTLFVGISSFLLLWDASPALFLPSGSVASQPLPDADSYMKATESVQYSATGEREYRLTTEESRFFEDEGYWQADMPHLVAYDSNNKNHPWELKAIDGEVLGQGNEIRLRNNVVGWQFTEVDRKHELRTEELVFYPKEQTVETDQPLTLNSPRGVTTATGMRANFSTEVFTLLSKVRGKYSAP